MGGDCGAAAGMGKGYCRESGQRQDRESEEGQRRGNGKMEKASSEQERGERWEMVEKMEKGWQK